MRFWPRWEQKKNDLHDELEAHLQIAVEERVARGESREQAQAVAMSEIGNSALVADVTRGKWGWQWVEHLAQDVLEGRIALRVAEDACHLDLMHRINQGGRRAGLAEDVANVGDFRDAGTFAFQGLRHLDAEQALFAQLREIGRAHV